MNIGAENFLAILAMGVATYGVRLAGLLIAGHIPQTGRARAALEALPAAVLTAVVAPMALTTGPAETIAAAIAILAAFRLPILGVVAVGVVSVVLLRLVFG